MHLSLCLLICAVISCAQAATTTPASHDVSRCPPHLPRDEYLRFFGESCYSFRITTDRDFPTAERTCEGRQGHLVTIKDNATQAFIYNTLRDEFDYDGEVWIGLTDSRSEGHFEWVDGTDVTYTNWASGQPGLLGGLEDCAALNMDSDGKWHDYRCETYLFFYSDHMFVCEYPLNSGPTTTVTSVVS